MSSVDTAIVTKNLVPAGVLSNQGGNITFAYLPEYLDSDMPAIATTLPKSAQVLTFSNGATPAFFAGLLPEGRRLNAIATRLKTSSSNEIALLVELGSELVGDVQVLANRDKPPTSTAIAIPRDTSKISFTQLREQYFDSSAAGLPGYQDKISSKMLNAPARSQGFEYILKFNPTEAPYAVENENYFLGLANAVSLKTASFTLLTDCDGQHALRLQRFDRFVEGNAQGRLAMEDGCQVLGLYPSQKYEVTFEDVADGLIGLCSAKKVAALELIQQLAFSYLIGNGDAHAKNFSVLQNRNHEWRISPAYDLLCTAFYDDKDMALPLAGETKKWTRQMLLDFGSARGVPASLAEKFLDVMLAKIAKLPAELDSGVLPFRRDENYAASKLIRARMRHLADD